MGAFRPVLDGRHFLGVCPGMRSVGAFRPWLGQCHFLGVRPSIQSVAFLLVTSMYQSYRIRHSNPTLLDASNSCFSPYLLILASGGHFHHSVLSFPSQNPCFDSILGWNGGARRQRAHHQHSATPLTAFQKEFVRKSSSGSGSVGRGWEDMILPGREDSQNLGKSEWDQKLGKIECVFVVW